MSEYYSTEYNGGGFTDNPTNPTVEVDYTAIGGGYAVEGTVFPFGRYAQDGSENGDFSTFDYTLTRDALIAYRDMLTEIINKAR